jgi:o-succinylbenzoate synthase
VSVVVEMRDDDGIVGFGEAAPLDGMSPEPIDDVIAVLASGGEPPPSLPSACFAVETARLSAEAQRKRVPLSQLLSQSAVATLPIAPVVDDVVEARLAWEHGARTFKLKIGPGELGRVVAMVEAMPGARFRIDANRSWPAGDTRAMLAELRGFPIDYVEEPCMQAHRLLDDGELALPIALDEGLRDVPDLAHTLHAPQLAAVVIKPTLHGLLRGLDIARHARVAVISHALEGSIGFAACCEFALACGHPGPMGLAPHPGLSRWLPRVHQVSGYTIQQVAPGLGFSPAPASLADIVIEDRP